MLNGAPNIPVLSAAAKIAVSPPVGRVEFSVGENPQVFGRK
jgi:hypothetical protein